MDDASLWDAYRKTKFEADTPLGKVTIRIGECSAEVDELLVEEVSIDGMCGVY